MTRTNCAHCGAKLSWTLRNQARSLCNRCYANPSACEPRVAPTAPPSQPTPPTSPTPPAALAAAWLRVEEAWDWLATAPFGDATLAAHELVLTTVGDLLASRRACVEAGWRGVWARTCDACEGKGQHDQNLPCVTSEGRGWVP